MYSTHPDVLRALTAARYDDLLRDAETRRFVGHARAASREHRGLHRRRHRR